MPLSHHLGLEISDNALRLVEVRINDGFPIVLRCDVAEASHAYGSDLLHRVPFDYELAKAFITDIAGLFHGRTVLSNRISVVLPATVPLLVTLPVDADLSPSERDEHLQWECRTLSGAPDNAEFHLYQQSLGHGKDTEILLVAAMPRETVRFLKSAFEHLTFQVSGIEIDHFLYETFIPTLYPQAARATFAVLGIAPPRCIASVTGEDGYLGMLRGTITRAGHAELDALTVLHGVLHEHPATVMQAIFLYGPGATEHSAQALSRLLDVPVHAVHPMRAVSFIAGAEAEKARAHTPETFDAALCAAMKGAL
ncbi:MAG: hypothetical protein IPP94_00695 [Ignavibacteria bacterium]|nr:hypothetical protein [Ignavibacteria bacterium]